MGLSGCVNGPKEAVQFSIISFNVDPSIINIGESTNLSWVVIAATSVTIDNGIGDVPLTGHRTILPTVTTTYTLTASNATTNKHVTVEIIVRNSNEGDDVTPPITPTISMTPDTSDTNTTLSIASVSTQGVAWSDVTYILVDKTNTSQFPGTAWGTAYAWGSATAIKLSDPTSGYVQGGQIITIKGTGLCLTNGHQYTLNLQYIPSGGTLSTTTWTQ